MKMPDRSPGEQKLLQFIVRSGGEEIVIQPDRSIRTDAFTMAAIDAALRRAFGEVLLVHAEDESGAHFCAEAAVNAALPVDVNHIQCLQSVR